MLAQPEGFSDEPSESVSLYGFSKFFAYDNPYFFVFIPGSRFGFAHPKVAHYQVFAGCFPALAENKFKELFPLKTESLRKRKLTH